VTDANVVLGYLNPDYFLGGEMSLDVAGARAAIDAQVARPLGLEAADAAWGIHEAVTSNMEHAIRSVSIERGRDPRELTLVAFGGAGPSHAARLARNLGIGAVVFPAAAGIASAVGLLQAAPRVDVERTFVARVDDEGLQRLRGEVAALDESVLDMLARVSPDAQHLLRRVVDMQYVGQGHVIEVELPPLDDPDFRVQLNQRFEKRYASLYGYSYEGATPEIVALKVTGSAAAGAFQLPANEAVGSADPTVVRPVYFPEAGGYVATPSYKRDELPAGCEIVGPAVIEDGQCAALLLPGDSATIDQRRNVIAAVDSASAPGDLLLAATAAEAAR
jgi:N-methylhydantoinase A/oxoprolinase/acetone carboxylase beta subunit